MVKKFSTNLLSKPKEGFLAPKAGKIWIRTMSKISKKGIKKAKTLEMWCLNLEKTIHYI